MLMRFFLRYKLWIKQTVYILSFVIILVALVSFSQIIENIRSEAVSYVRFRISVFENLLQSEQPKDISFLFQNLVSKTAYPAVLTDADTIPQAWINLDLDEDTDTLTQVRQRVSELADQYQPIPIRYDRITIAYYYYGEPAYLIRLEWLPYAVLGLITIIFVIANYGYNVIRQSEKRFIWYGMAKEAAHQLGTPLSSVQGWMDLIREDGFKTEYIDEINRDLDRIQLVVNRFSEIGSTSRLQIINIVEIASATLDYFRERAPKISRNVEFHLQTETNVLTVHGNPLLLIWVLENLVKNALDSMTAEQGTIAIQIQSEQKWVVVRVVDTGSGIKSEFRRRIFEPGFTTKRRGWGIGLSLSKRIVDHIHRGHLFVEKTEAGVGTTMRMDLRASTESSDAPQPPVFDNSSN